MKGRIYGSLAAAVDPDHVSEGHERDAPVGE